jgi:hypothetical protein
MQAKDHTCEQSKFDQWAYRRGLEHTYPSLDEINARPAVTEVGSAWQEAFALNRAFVETLNRAQLGPSERNRRFLYGLVRSLVEENSLLLPRLNQKSFFAFPIETDKQDQNATDRVVKAAFALTHYLEGKRFKALLEDFDTTKDRSAPYKKLVVLDRAYRRTTEAPSALPHIKAHATSVTEYLKSHYDLEKAFKDSRKTAKAYWSLVKAFEDLVSIKSGVPEWLVEPCGNFAEKWYQTKLPLVTLNSARKRFDPDAIAAIKKKSTGSPVHLRFFAFLEAINVACAIWDRRDAKGDTDAAKKNMALTGAVFSLTSSVLSVTKATKKEWTTAKWLGPVVKGDVAKGALGAASSFIDLATGGLALVDDVAVDDSKAAVFHGTQAAGGVISLVGYVLIATGGGAPVGAALVFLGSALGMAGSVGGNLAKSSDLENWMKYCQWGELAGKEGAGESVQSWAEGRPKDLHLMVGRQIRTLNTLIVGLKVDAVLVYDQIQHPSVEVTVHLNILADEGCIHLEVVIDGVVMRKLSPWKHGKDRRDADGAFRERFSAEDATRVNLRVHTDPFGGGHFWHPIRPLDKAVILQRPQGMWPNMPLARPY